MMEDECPICYEIMQAPIILACGHTFCEDCAQEWCGRDRTCPLCRAPVQKKDLQRMVRKGCAAPAAAPATANSNTDGTLAYEVLLSAKCLPLLILLLLVLK